MHLSVSGKQLDIGDALKSHVQQGLTTTVTKYFDNAIEAHVVFSRVGHQIRSDISVHVGRGIIVQGHGESGDPYAAFDIASDRIGKRLRRYKGRLRDHHRDRAEQSDRQVAQQQLTKRSRKRLRTGRQVPLSSPNRRLRSPP
jgi:ribosomal subunit interface protein